MKEIIKKIISSLLIIIIFAQFLPAKKISASIEIQDLPRNVKYPSFCEWKIQSGEKPKEFESDFLKYAKADLFLRDACTFFKKAEENAVPLIKNYQQIIENTDPLTKCNPIGNCYANCNVKGPKIDVNIDITVLVCDLIASLAGAPGGCSALLSMEGVIEVIDAIYKIVNVAEFVSSNTQNINDVVNAFNSLGQNYSQFYRLVGIMTDQVNNIINSGIINEILTGQPSQPGATTTILQSFAQKLADLFDEKTLAQQRGDLLKGRISEIEYFLKLNLISLVKVPNDIYQSFISNFSQVASSAQEISNIFENNSKWKEILLSSSGSSPGPGYAYFYILNTKIGQNLEKYPLVSTSANYVLINKELLQKTEEDLDFQNNFNNLDQIVSRINKYISTSNNENDIAFLNSLKTLISNFKGELNNLKSSLEGLESSEIAVSRNQLINFSNLTNFRASLEKFLNPENKNSLSSVNEAFSLLVNLFQSPLNGLTPEEITSTTLALMPIQESLINLEPTFNLLYQSLFNASPKDAIEIVGSFKDTFLDFEDKLSTTSQAFLNFLQEFQGIINSVTTSATTVLDTLDQPQDQQVVTFKDGIDLEINNIKKVLDLNDQETLAYQTKILADSVSGIINFIQNNFSLNPEDYSNILDSSVADIEEKIHEALISGATTTQGQPLTINFQRTDNSYIKIESESGQVIPWTKIKSIQIPEDATSISPLTITFSLKAYDDVLIWWGPEFGWPQPRTYPCGKIYRNGTPVSQEFCGTYNTWQTFSTTVSGWQPGDLVELYVQNRPGVGKNWVENDLFEVKGTATFLPKSKSFLELLYDIQSSTWKDTYDCSSILSTYDVCKKETECTTKDDGTKECHDVCKYETHYVYGGQLANSASSTLGILSQYSSTIPSSTLGLASTIYNNTISYCNDNSPTGTPNSICNAYNALYQKLKGGLWNKIQTGLEDGKISPLIFAFDELYQEIRSFQDKLNNLFKQLDDLYQEVSGITTGLSASDKQSALDNINDMKAIIINSSINKDNLDKNYNFLKSLSISQGDLKNLGNFYQTIEKLEDLITKDGGIEDIQDEISNFMVGVTSTQSSVSEDLNKIREKITKFQTNFQIGLLTKIYFPPPQEGWMAMWNRDYWQNDDSCVIPIPVERDKIQCCLPDSLATTELEVSSTTPGEESPARARSNEVMFEIKWPRESMPCATYDSFFTCRDPAKVRLFTGCWKNGGQIGYAQLPSNFQIRNNRNLSTSGQCNTNENEFITYIEHWPECRQVCVLGGEASRYWGSGSCSCPTNWLTAAGCLICCSLKDCYQSNNCARCGGTYFEDKVVCGKIYDSNGNQVTYSNKVCYNSQAMCQSLQQRYETWKCAEPGTSTIQIANSIYEIGSSTKDALCPPIITEMNKIGCSRVLTRTSSSPNLLDYLSSLLLKKPINPFASTPSATSSNPDYCTISTEANCFETYDTSCGNLDFYNKLVYSYGIDPNYLKDIKTLPNEIKGDLTKMENTSVTLLQAMSLIGILETIALAVQTSQEIFKSVKTIQDKLPPLINGLLQAVNATPNLSNLINGVGITAQIEGNLPIRCTSSAPISRYQKEGSNYNPVCAPTKNLVTEANKNYSNLRNFVRKVIWIRDKNRITNLISKSQGGPENPDTPKIEALAKAADIELRLNRASWLWSLSIGIGEAGAPYCTCGNTSQLCDLTFCFPSIYDIFYPIVKNLKGQIKEQLKGVDLTNLPDLQNWLNSDESDCDKTLWENNNVQEALRKVIDLILRNIYFPQTAYNPQDHNGMDYKQFIDETTNEYLEKITSSLIGPKEGVCELPASLEPFTNPFCLTTWFFHYLAKGLDAQITQRLEDYIYQESENITY